MKESIHYWTIGCHKPVQESRSRRLSESRYLSANGQLGDYSTHCMIEDQQTALEYARAMQLDQPGKQSLVIEPMHLLISPGEQKRMLRRIAEQSQQIRNKLMQQALAML